jgi:hypothetical protein
MKITNAKQSIRTPARAADTFDTYLAELREMPEPLDRAAEVRAAERIE